MSQRDVPSLSTYERWDGFSIGDHQYSTLESFTCDPQNVGHDRLSRVANRLVNGWDGDHFAGVLFYGEPGTGKTHAAIGLARALHDKGADIFYRYVPELTELGASVSDWTAPRVFENRYFMGGDTSVTTTQVERSERREISTALTRIEHGNDVRIKRDPASVFPSYYEKGIERNPKTVLLLDDYKPRWRANVRAAIEAASNFGGLIIMTSNFNNVNSFADPSGNDLTQYPYDYGHSAEESSQQAIARSAETEVLRRAMMSRLAAGFVEVEFTAGVDGRREGSFWGAELLTPDDFS